MQLVACSSLSGGPNEINRCSTLEFVVLLGAALTETETFSRQ